MNREIADAGRWGKREILARSDQLAERATELWPGPLASEITETDERTEWIVLRQILAALPAGSWATYGDLAAVIGVHPRPLGTYLGTSLEVSPTLTVCSCHRGLIGGLRLARRPH